MQCAVKFKSNSEQYLVKSKIYPGLWDHGGEAAQREAGGGDGDGGGGG